jgi:Secretion system C-terminal sorting domain
MKFKNAYALIAAVALFANVLKAETPNNPVEIAAKAGIEIGAINKTLLVQISDAENQNVEVIILDDSREVYRETFAGKSSLIKRFDLKRLDAGSYQLVIKKAGMTTVQPFEVDFTKINVLSDKLETIFKPRVAEKNGKILVSFLASTPTNVDVRVYDNAGVTVFQENYKTTLLQKAYNLTNLPKGVYFVEVTTDVDTEYFTITK